MTDDGALARKLLSDVTVYGKYARHLPEAHRRENWGEVCERYEGMMVEKYPDHADDIIKAMQGVEHKEYVPSMRGLQFAGKAVLYNNTRLYNCAFLRVDDMRAFPEIMFLLLSGTGVGYSVQKHHVSQLSKIQERNPYEVRFIVQDSIIGWADAIKSLVRSFFEGRNKIIFDFHEIRPKGAPLKTSGGRAPGPEPLKTALCHIETIFERKQPATRLSTLEVHDIICHIADCVLSGGVRRSACLALFTFDDTDMITAKAGDWYEANPQRARANNSAAILRGRVTEREFKDYMRYVAEIGFGEPGFAYTNNPEWGLNPCAEIGLRNMQFCNLAEINASTIRDKRDFLLRCHNSAIIGTLQASFTDFHYLRPKWRETTEREALLGISITGVASNTIGDSWLAEGADLIRRTNEEWAHRLDINPAARLTTIKPSGTSSLVLGTSSGIHAWHAPYYIRRLRMNKMEPLCRYLQTVVPDLIEPDVQKPDVDAVLSLPMKAPDGAVLRGESFQDALKRVMTYNKNWVRKGHVRGANPNNVSVTINVKDHEWPEVVDALWNHREEFTAISTFPYFGGNYKQAPHEDCDERTYSEMLEKVRVVNLDHVIEHEDNTERQAEVACAGGECEVTSISSKGNGSGQGVDGFEQSPQPVIV